MLTATGGEDSVEIGICTLNEIVEGRFTGWIDHLRDEVTVLKDGEGYRVFSSVCPHFGGEFDFDVRKNTAKCKWHAWEFDLQTGKCLTYPKLRTCLRIYPYEIRQGKIFVRAQK